MICKILYINGEYCSSIEQLKGYFMESLTSWSDTYADLLDYGRSGDIAVWLREKDEPELASKVESISTNQSDSAFYAQLKAAIVGLEIVNVNNLKPSFDKCFMFEGMKCDVKDKEAKVRVSLKVLMSVNEEYVLCVSSSWGTRAMMVNPYNYVEGETAVVEFTLRKRQGKDIGTITIKLEGKELSSKKNQTLGSDIEIPVGDVVLKMIHVEGGTFIKRATSGVEYLCYNDEKTTQKVTVSSFYIGETPITQELWNAIMEFNPSRFEGDHLPVERVLWNDCLEFITRLNLKTGKNFRLPTETEWEFAARGGNKSDLTQYSGCDNLDEVAWYHENSGGYTHPIKTKKANELGIYDMRGNVWEWCNREHAYNNTSPENPIGPTSWEDFVAYGGCFMNNESNCYSTKYHPLPDSLEFSNRRTSPFGLRLVLSEFRMPE